VVIAGLKTVFADFLVQRYVENRRSWKELDTTRLLLFGTWGVVWLGGVQYFLQVYCFAFRWFPEAAKFAAKPWSAKLTDKAGQLTVAKQVFIDQFVHHPFFFFPAFYSVKALLEITKETSTVETTTSSSASGSASASSGTASTCTPSAKAERSWENEVVGYEGFDRAMDVATQAVRTGLSNYAKNWKEDLLTCWQIWVPSMTLNFSICPLWARVPFVAGVSLFFTMLLSARRGAPLEDKHKNAKPTEIAYAFRRSFKSEFAARLGNGPGNEEEEKVKKKVMMKFEVVNRPENTYFTSTKTSKSALKSIESHRFYS